MTREQLAAAGFPVAAAAYARLAHFVELLLRENRVVNLTAIREPDDIWRLHVCESLALGPLIEQSHPRTLLDLGTGGGLPGIPLACVYDDLEITLLDATRKKLLACERMVTELGLRRVGLIWGRAEVLAHEEGLREVFDVVTARGVAPLPTLIEYAAGFIRPGGWAWFAKPTASEGDITRADSAARQCGLEHTGTRPLVIPGDTRRSILIYHKRRALRHDLPRANGLPRRRPL